MSRLVKAWYPPVRRAIAWFSLLVFALQSGCAALQVKEPETAYQENLGRVAVIGLHREAAINFEGFSRGKGEGAAYGAGSTFMSCMTGIGQGGCSGEFCGAALILILGICGVAGAIGAVAGAGAAPPAGEAQRSEQDLTALVQARDIQDTLSRQVAAFAFAQGETLASPAQENVEQARLTSDYRTLAGEGVDTVLEVALTKAGTRGTGVNAPIQLYMEAHVRLVRTADNSELFGTDYEYQGGKLKLAEWSANQGRALLDGLEEGYAALGSHIYDSIFLLFPFPDRGAHPAGMLAAAFGLAPIEPATRGQLSGDKLIGSHFEWTTVDSLHPVLSWQAFPRATDVADAPELAARIGKVRYDLVVARERNLAPAGIVYRREGLITTTHAVQVGLQPDTRYFWTVRARFELDGRERVTEWATTDYRALDRVTSPSPWSYRFRTR